VADEEDRVAVARVLAGEVEAFEGIVRRWQGPLVNLAYRFSRDRGLAEELAQDALVRAFRGLARWRGDSRFSTWLFAVALNVYRSRLRRARIEEVPLEALRNVADSRNVDHELEARDRADLVRRGVLALPGRYRDALVLFYFHELSVEEAARSLGLPEGTVKARLHRGRAILRRELAGLIPADEREGD
jgi:RNA polymerase sigma-70 factor (ECF subfamily)